MFHFNPYIKQSRVKIADLRTEALNLCIILLELAFFHNGVN